MAGGAADFLRIMNEQNDRMAARQVEKEADVDQIQLQRDRERREKWGRLRARPHQGKRQKRASPSWDTIDINI